MTQTEQILEYIDGLLDSDAEQGLFDAMARQPELRSALRQFIAIGDAVRADREAYTPPSHVERTLMAGLGITQHAPVAGGMGLMARLAALGGRYMGMIVAFLLGMLVAGGTAYLVTGSSETRVELADGGSSSNNSRSGQVRTDAGTSKSLPQMGTGMNGAAAGTAQNNGGLPAQGTQPAQASASTSTRSADVTTRTREGTRSWRSRSMNNSMNNGGNGSGNGGGSRIDAAALSSNGALPTETVPTSDAASATSSASGAIVPDITSVTTRAEASRRDDLPASQSELSPQTLPEDFPLPVQFNQDAPESRDGVLALELRRNFGGPFNPNQARRSTPALDNWMVGIFSNPKSAFSFGAEAGHESFDQTLHYDDNDTLQVEQRPSFVWFGLAGRLNVAQLPLEGSGAFVQGTLAYSTGGPIMRMRLGGEVPVFGRASFMAGLETSALVYSFRNQYSITGRWGVTTGLMWTF